MTAETSWAEIFEAQRRFLATMTPADWDWYDRMEAESLAREAARNKPIKRIVVDSESWTGRKA